MALPFTTAQVDAFFDDATQMGLPAGVRARLANEGLATVEDFEDFKKDQLERAFKNMRTAIPGIPAVTARRVTTVPAIPAIPPCLVSARCALRLSVASVAYHYYSDIGRIQTPANMDYTNVLRGFYVEWESITKLMEEDRPVVPVLSKNNTPLKWLESFKDCTYRTFGVRNCPVSYIIRDDDTVPAEADDPLQAGRAYGESGSVIDEMIRRLNHTDPLYKSDNALVYSMLEEATRGTIYGPTIKPYARLKNGRGAFRAIVQSHAGDDKWEQVKKNKLNFLMNTKWNGRTYSLDKFTGLHRSAYVQLEEAQEHVNFQLPTQHSRVGFLLDNIVNNDPDLRAALASIRVNTDNMRDDFEAAVAFMLPVCPYSKHRQSQRGGRRAEISDTQLLGKGSSATGVDLRWHTKAEYAKLNKAQRQELYKWQQSKDGKEAKENALNNSKKPTKKQLQAQLNSIQRQLESEQDSTSTDQNESEESTKLSEIKACISTAFAELQKQQSPVKRKEPADPCDIAAATIQKIIKRGRS